MFCMHSLMRIHIYIYIYIYICYRSLKSTFERKDGSTISFAKYYQDCYDLKVSGEAAEARGLLVFEQKSRKRGKKEIYLIPDFCHLTGVYAVLYIYIYI